MLLKEFGKKVFIEAEKIGLSVRSVVQFDWTMRETWPQDALGTNDGIRLSFDVTMLLEMGLAELNGDMVIIPYTNFPEIRSEDFQIITAFTKPCPFLLNIDRISDIGYKDFAYRYRFISGSQAVPLTRYGYYVTRTATGEIWHLDDSMFSILDAMDEFNHLKPEEKNSQESWLTFAKVKRLSKEANAILEMTLEKNDVIVPSSIGLDMYEDANGALSFVPRCNELDDAKFRTVFERNDNAEGFYSLDQQDGLKKLRVVLTDRQRAVLNRMKRVQRVTGAQKEALKKDPGAVFDGIAGDVDLPYSDRVIGIGEFQFTPVPMPDRDEEGFTKLWSDQDTDPSEKDTSPKESEDTEKPKKLTLLISTHDETVPESFTDESENARGFGQNQLFERPKSLSENTLLKSHQEDGVRWLQRCARIEDRQGVLLADDMGLGKTLQILSFLAWAIESGHFPDLSSDRPPYRPILIVAPLILLDTGTWENEISRFFDDDGFVFGEPLPLYGNELKAYRRRDAEGREEHIGKPILDLDRIRKRKVVITNYEAVRDYEFSFAYHPDGKPLWSIVVTDEAQEYKTPNTKISHAIKAIRPDFRIACTGTPVENRLLDLWNIFDAIQPGLLGAAKDFTQRYEARSENTKTDSTSSDLKERLLYRKPHAFLLRRGKEEVLDLPKKIENKIACSMSDFEVECHIGLTSKMNPTIQTRNKLDLLQQFARLYQHPALLQDADADASGVDDLLKQSSKLSKLIEVLHKIKNKNEKAIIFCRHKAMQRVLVKVISSEFRKNIRIINGDTPRAVSLRKSGVETRNNILEDYKKGTGFDVLILSPFVAGVGLTIVEANHVIHYGRWWNPAVEAQATDRAYRIGQTREVHVYFFINEDKSNRIGSTFDQLLDNLMERKKDLARSAFQTDEFLLPREEEQQIGMEVYSRLNEGANKVL